MNARIRKKVAIRNIEKIIPEYKRLSPYKFRQYVNDEVFKDAISNQEWGLKRLMEFYHPYIHYEVSSEFAASQDDYIPSVAVYTPELSPYGNETKRHFKNRRARWWLWFFESHGYDVKIVDIIDMETGIRHLMNNEEWHGLVMQDLPPWINPSKYKD
jgi:hypothetical protein